MQQMEFHTEEGNHRQEATQSPQKQSALFNRHHGPRLKGQLGNGVASCLGASYPPCILKVWIEMPSARKCLLSISVSLDRCSDHFSFRRCFADSNDRLRRRQFRGFLWVCGTLGLLCGLTRFRVWARGRSSFFTMSACSSISVAVPVVSASSKTVRASCVRQRIGIAGQAGFPSLHYMSCRSGNFCVTKQWQKQCAPKASRMTRIMASQEGVPQEILDDSKFVPINEDDPRFGPPAMLLLGFGDDEVATVLEMIKDMGGDFMQVLLCTDEMTNGTLNEALNSTQPDLSQVKAASGMPPICFLSGLSGEELMMVVRAFPEAGLTGTAFAAHVPKNSNKPLRELIEEIMGDHERLSKPQQSAQA